MQETQFGITEDSMKRIAQSGKEPDWVESIRKTAWEKFQSMDPPPPNHEEWRKLHVEDFRWQDLTLPLEPNGSQLPDGVTLLTGKTEDEFAGSIVQCNGHTVLSNTGKLPSGVVFEPIQDAFRNHGNRLLPYLTEHGLSCDRDKFTALHFALFNQGIFIYVPEDIQVDLPIRYVSVIGGANHLILPHVVVVLRRGASLNFLYEMAGAPGEGITYNYGMVQFFVEEGAKLGYLSLHNWGDHVVDRTIQKAVVSGNGRMNWTAYLGGAKASKWNFEADLIGEYSDVTINGAYKIKNKEHIDVFSHLRHQVPNTHGHVLVNGSANDSSQATIQGLIEIEKGAQKTITYLENHNLLLGKKCVVDSVPRLQILADDVKASHGVTLTDIDDEDIFYLMSRGVEKKEARALIVDGFFRDILRRAETPLFQTILADALGMEVRDQ